MPAGYGHIRYAAPGAHLNFQWDPSKAASNLEKHGLSFDEASTAFGDPLSRAISDPAHSEDEERYLLLGLTYSGRLVVVSFVDRDETVRLISARPASRRERKTYERTSR